MLIFLFKFVILLYIVYHYLIIYSFIVSFYSDKVV